MAELMQADRKMLYLVVRLAGQTPAHVEENLTRLHAIARQSDAQIGVLHAPEDTDDMRSMGGIFRRTGVTTVQPLAKKWETFFFELLTGGVAGAQSCAFVGDPAHLTADIVRAADITLVGCGTAAVPKDVETGCTLITSVFRAETFLPGFIKNTLRLKGYDALVDHVFLVSNLSEVEASELVGIATRKPNVVIFWNRKDPGLYNCWNLGIQLSRRRYVSNANVDDLRDPDHLLCLLKDLEAHPDVAVAATALNPFYDFPDSGDLPEERPGWYSDRAGYFGFFDIAILGDNGELVPHNMPHCMPVWRRSLHDSYGWFDEDTYGTFADWAFWLRVLQDNNTGWLNPAPNAFYFVNPTSHNRRGSNLQDLHAKVEKDFGPFFKARQAGKPFPARPVRADLPKKLTLSGRAQIFGQHRNNFNELIKVLEPAEAEDGNGVLFLPFLERTFVWGGDPGEARSSTPGPIEQDWVGILHVPFDTPDWFHPELRPETFLTSPLVEQSLPHCRGIITLSRDIEADLQAFLPQIRTLSVRHPVEMDVRMFDPKAYLAHPRIVQVGDWLRKLQAIHRIKSLNHERVMLMKPHTQSYLEKDIAQFGDHLDPAVKMLDMVSAEEYDQFLSSSVVLCLMYATAANNVVIECIARATPILINPLPAVVEYLGHGYPLFVTNETEAAQLLATPGRVREAHEYLLQRRLEIDLSYCGFRQDIIESQWYVDLETCGKQ